jgi:hypothetical protein
MLRSDIRKVDERSGDVISIGKLVDRLMITTRKSEQCIPGHGMERRVICIPVSLLFSRIQDQCSGMFTGDAQENERQVK